MPCSARLVRQPIIGRPAASSRPQRSRCAAGPTVEGDGGGRWATAGRLGGAAAAGAVGLALALWPGAAFASEKTETGAAAPGGTPGAAAVLTLRSEARPEAGPVRGEGRAPAALASRLRSMIRRGEAREDAPDRWLTHDELAEAECEALDGIESQPANAKFYYRVARAWLPGGWLVADPRKSRVRDPREIGKRHEREMQEGPKAEERKNEVEVRPEVLRYYETMDKFTYSRLWQAVGEHRVEKVVFTPDGRGLDVHLGDSYPGGRRVEHTGVPFDPDLIDHLLAHGVAVEQGVDSAHGVAARTLATYMLPVSIVVVAMAYMRAVAASMPTSNPGRGIFEPTMARLEPGSETARFTDVAGAEAAVAEVREVADYLRDPSRYREAGARSPAGVLLVGPPGTGKTLLARALAGESQVPFLATSGGDFDGGFAGAGASRVRELFAIARRAAPCVVFIDEIDGVARERTESGVEDSESVGTVNQLLIELDGFESNAGVVVVAATNRANVLDPAVLRPGRFDRIIPLGFPDAVGRERILAVHLRGRSVDPALDLPLVARSTPSFSGAMLMGLVNRAAAVAYRRGVSTISTRDCLQALDDMLKQKAGLNPTTLLDRDLPPVPLHVRRASALRQAARVVLATALGDAHDPVARVSVCPGRSIDSRVVFLPAPHRQDSRTETRETMEAAVVVGLAGRCAERLCLGDAYLSAAGGEDIDKANEAARDMVISMGMGRRVGPVYLGAEDRGTDDLGAEPEPAVRASSPLLILARRDVEEILSCAEAKAYVGLVKNWAALELVTNELVERQELAQLEVAELLRRARIVPFSTTSLEGFSWSSDGRLTWPDAERVEPPTWDGAAPGGEPRAPPADSPGPTPAPGARAPRPQARAASAASLLPRRAAVPREALFTRLDEPGVAARHVPPELGNFLKPRSEAGALLERAFSPDGLRRSLRGRGLVARDRSAFARDPEVAEAAERAGPGESGPGASQPRPAAPVVPASDAAAAAAARGATAKGPGSARPGGGRRRGKGAPKAPKRATAAAAE